MIKICRTPVELYDFLSNFSCRHVRAKVQHLYTESLSARFGKEIPTIADLRSEKVKPEEFNSTVFVSIDFSSELDHKVAPKLTIKQLLLKHLKKDSYVDMGVYHYETEVSGVTYHVFTDFNALREKSSWERSGDSVTTAA